MANFVDNYNIEYYVIYYRIQYQLNKMEIIQQEEPYGTCCCYTPGSPDSLVLLSTNQMIMQKLLSETDYFYFWISEPNSVNSKIFEFVEKSIPGHYKIYPTLLDMLNELPNNYNASKKIIICPPSLTQEARGLLRCTFHGILEYPPSKNLSKSKSTSSESLQTSDTMEQIIDDSYSLNLSSCDEDQKILRPQNDEQFFKTLRCNIWGVVIVKNFPNFISLRNEVTKSHLLISTMFAMLNQKIDHKTSYQIICKLELLAEQLIKFHPKLDKAACQQIFDELKKNENLNQQRILKIYTLEQPHFYVIVNVLLRALTQPTQHFILQPIFKCLFNIVQRLCKSQKKEQSFYCYRGVTMIQRQKNQMYRFVGDVVQNLGFLSTSLDEQTATNFMRNGFFQIHVSHNQQFNLGFANVSNFSEFQQQSQVLFNPLNYFRVKEFKKCEYTFNNKYQKMETKVKVILDFGTMPQIDRIQQHFMSQEDITISRLLKFQKEYIINGNQCQGDVLSSINRFLYNDAQSLIFGNFYWSKHNQITKEALQMNQKQTWPQIPQNIIKKRKKLLKKLSRGKFIKASILYKMNRYLESRNLCQSSIAMEKQEFGQYNILDIGFLLCKINFKMGNLNQVSSIISECETTYNLSKQSQIRQKFLKFQYIKALLIHSFGKLQKAIDHYEQCLAEQRQIIGEIHPLFIMNLVDFTQILKEQGCNQRVFQIQSKCLNLLREFFDEGHRDYLFNLTNFGQALFLLGRHNEAIQIYKRVLSIQKRTAGEKHCDTMTTLSKLGHVFIQLKQYHEALIVSKRCLLIKSQQFGVEHILTIKQMNNVAWILFLLGNNKQAINLYAKCEALAKTTLGQNDLEYNLILEGYISCLIKQKRYDIVFSFMQKAERFILKNRGQRNTIFREMVNCHFDNLIKVGKQEQAQQFYQQFMISQQILQQSEQVNLKYMFNYLRILLHLGKKQSADAAFTKVQIIYSKISLKRQKNYFQIVNMLELFFCYGQFQYAFKILKQFVSGIKLLSLNEQEFRYLQSICHFLLNIDNFEGRLKNSISILKQLKQSVHIQECQPVLHHYNALIAQKQVKLQLKKKQVRKSRCHADFL